MSRCYPQLSLDERRKIANWRYAKTPVSEIADKLDRDPSTIYREIKRNSVRFDDQPELNGYQALCAQDKCKGQSAIDATAGGLACTNNQVGRLKWN